ncbi:MAG: ORF6N domain-containing protein [Bacteroides sp.]|nr:ORF6N domain-containing protein [Bacteroides sp.]
MELQAIQNKIYEIRGLQVMLDFDLAALYGSETKRLKEAVRRNIRRFPEDFMFELTKAEYEVLRTQFATSNKRGGTRYMPFAFTEQGVAMLSSVLNSEVAIEVNISIMRAFVSVRRYLSETSHHAVKEIEDLKQRMKALEEGSEDAMAAINDLSEDTRKELDDIYLALSQLAGKQKQVTEKACRKPVGFIHYDKNKGE